MHTHNLTLSVAEHRVRNALDCQTAGLFPNQLSRFRSKPI